MYSTGEDLRLCIADKYVQRYKCRHRNTKFWTNIADCNNTNHVSQDVYNYEQ